MNKNIVHQQRQQRLGGVHDGSFVLLACSLSIVEHLVSNDNLAHKNDFWESCTHLTDGLNGWMAGWMGFRVQAPKRVCAPTRRYNSIDTQQEIIIDKQANARPTD